MERPAVELMEKIFSELPEDQKSKCSLCNETLTDVVKKIEARTQSSNREACRFIADKIGITAGAARKRISRYEGGGTNRPIEDEWRGMPEFDQNKKSDYKKLVIRFETEEDYQDFAKLIGQKLTAKTKSIWYPFKSHWGQTENKVYR